MRAKKSSTVTKKSPSRASTRKRKSTIATVTENLPAQTSKVKTKKTIPKKDQTSSAMKPTGNNLKVETSNITIKAPARKKSATNIVTTATEGSSTLTPEEKTKINFSKKELPSESSTKSSVIENSIPFKRRNSNVKKTDEKSTNKTGNVKKTKKSTDNTKNKLEKTKKNNQILKFKAKNNSVTIPLSLFKKLVNNSDLVQKKDTIIKKQTTFAKRKSTTTSANQSKKMKQDSKTSNKENSDNSVIQISDDDDSEDCDDDYCMGPFCDRTTNNNYGANKEDANSNKNNDGAGSGNNSTGPCGSPSVSKCTNLCVDSCGESWQEISIDPIEKNEEIEDDTHYEINLALNIDNSFNLSTENSQLFNNMEENDDSVFIPQSPPALNNENDDDISINGEINEIENDDEENEIENDDEDNEMEIENIIEIEEEQMKNDKKNYENLKLKTKFYDSIDSRYVLVHLKDTIILQGTIKLKLLTGSIEIFGYKPKINEQLEIFSPRGYSNLLINSIKNSELQLSENHDGVDVVKDLSSIIKSSELLNEFHDNLLSNNIDDLLKNFNIYEDALILLERNERKEIEMINSYMRENMFLDITNIIQKRSLNSSEIILKCILGCENNNEEKEHANDGNIDHYDDNGNDKIKISDKWNNIEIKSNSKLMIIGGKNVGKSTLLRYLINKNLENHKLFLLIDIDIGQSEIFIPQTISVTLINKPLLGPGYLYSLKPLKSYLYGDTNIVQSPKSYLLIVKKLINYCYNISNNDYNNIPWLINTMGYNKGFGSELISIIIDYLKPTDIIQIEDKYKFMNNYDYHMSSNMIKNIPKYLFADEILRNNKINKELSNNHHNHHNHRLILLDSVVPNFNNKNLIKRKNHNNFPEITARDKRYEMMIAHCGRILYENNDEWLTDVHPYIVAIDKLNIISFENKFISKTNLLNVINGNFVYLCGDADADGCFECFGLGIVRAVNDVENTILILPSTTEEILKCSVTTLVECKIPLQSSVLLNQGPKVEDIAPYIYTTKNFIATRHIHPIYYRPNIKKLA